MSREPSKQYRREGRKDKDQGWIKEAVGSLTQDDKRRAEEEVDGAMERIEQAAGYLSKDRAKEASSALSSGRHRDKVAGTVDKTKGRTKETLSSFIGNKEKRAEGRVDQLKGRGQGQEGASQGPLQASLIQSGAHYPPYRRPEAMGKSGPASRKNVTVWIPAFLKSAGLAEKTNGKYQPGNGYRAYKL
jgi:uncharacterized protein YjbJ (UPF0337 family)